MEKMAIPTDVQRRVAEAEKASPTEVVEVDVGSCVLWLPDLKLRVECQRSNTFGVDAGRFSDMKDFYSPLSSMSLLEWYCREYSRFGSVFRTRINSIALKAMDDHWRDLRKNREVRKVRLKRT